MIRDLVKTPEAPRPPTFPVGQPHEAYDTRPARTAAIPSPALFQFDSPDLDFSIPANAESDECANWLALTPVWAMRMLHST